MFRCSRLHIGPAGLYLYLLSRCTLKILFRIIYCDVTETLGLTVVVLASFAAETLIMACPFAFFLCIIILL